MERRGQAYAVRLLLETMSAGGLALLKNRRRRERMASLEMQRRDGKGEADPLLTGTCANYPSRGDKGGHAPEPASGRWKSTGFRGEGQGCGPRSAPI